MNSRLRRRDLRLACNQVGNLATGETALPDFALGLAFGLEPEQVAARDLDLGERPFDGELIV